MLKRVLLLSAALGCLGAALPVQAEQRPVQLALFNPVQLFSEDDSVRGLRINFLYGKNTTVVGLDWGLVNHTTTGLSKGWQHGFVNLNEEDFLGFQDGGFNVTRGDFEGLQLGLLNYAGHASGLQLGFINYAERLNGLQIGLVNVIEQGGAFPVFPIVNWSFD